MPDTTARSSVTALLPAWQAADFIQATLDSLSAQTWPAFQVMVSVDLCDDDTLDICRRHAAADRRFRVLAQDERLGYVGNCNALLRSADSDYVMFAFHDDVLAPTCVSRLAETLDCHSEAVMCFPDMTVTDVDGTKEHCTFTALDGERQRLHRGMTMLQLTQNWWVPNRGLFRLETARSVGGLKIHGAGEFSADLPWLFALSLAGEFVRVPETLCFKYYKPGSLSRTWAFSKHQNHEVLAACMRELWDAAIPTAEKVALAAPLLNWLVRNAPEAQPNA